MKDFPTSSALSVSKFMATIWETCLQALSHGHSKTKYHVPDLKMTLPGSSTIDFQMGFGREKSFEGHGVKRTYQTRRKDERC